MFLSVDFFLPSVWSASQFENKPKTVKCGGTFVAVRHKQPGANSTVEFLPIRYPFYRSIGIEFGQSLYSKQRNFV